MKFFKSLNAEDFKEFMAVLVTLSIVSYLFLPGDWTDAATRGSMLTLLGVIIKHYFGEKNKKNDSDRPTP